MGDVPNINELFNRMSGRPAAMSAMRSTAERLCAEVKATQGEVDVNELTGGAVFIVTTILVDNSLSIRRAGNIGEVIRGYNKLLDAQRNSQEADDILISCQFLNPTRVAPSGILYPYSDLEEAQPLNQNNFHAGGGTPLYDRLAVALTGAALKKKEFNEAKISCRAVTVVVSDGDDQNHSVLHTPDTVREMVDSELRTERHTIAAIGLRDPESPVDYHDVFTRLGILPEWILTPDDSQSSIRSAFDLLSLQIAAPQPTPSGTLIDPVPAGSAS
jgi:hypothetical protein